MCELCWVVFPRLLQDRSLSGEPKCMVLVGMQARSGESLVKGSDTRKGLKSKHHSHEKTPLVAGFDIDLKLVYFN